MTCRSIVVQYTAHLMNRMNGIDIMRQGSMAITEPYKYTLPSIRTDGISQFKIVNRIQRGGVVYASP